MDSNTDSLVDLNDLSTALSKWLAPVACPGSQDLLHAFATAHGIALDFYTTVQQDQEEYS